MISVPRYTTIITTALIVSCNAYFHPSTFRNASPPWVTAVIATIVVIALNAYFW